MDIFSPTTVTTAAFLALFFIDLYNYNYKYLPVHAVAGFFCVLVVAALCQEGYYGTAWLLVVSPFLFVIGSLMVRDHRVEVSESKTLHPTPKVNTYAPAPYFL